MEEPSVQHGRTALCTVLYIIAVLTVSRASGQRCTTAISDPRNVNSYDASRLTPLLGQHNSETRSRRPEQWIFPNLQFTCNGMLTEWIFTGVSASALTCGIELETWELDITNTASVVYSRLSTTDRNVVTVRKDGTTFFYELESPVQVKPGDIVGIELGYSCASSESLDNIMSVNISETGSSYLSYRRDVSGSLFFLRSSSVIAEQDYIPLIEAVVDSNNSDIGGTTTPESDQSGEASTVAIVAGALGGVIGVVITVIVCVSVWCIARHVRTKMHNCRSERRLDSRRDQEHQDLEPKNVSNVHTISMQQNAAYKGIPGIRELSPKPPMTVSSEQPQVDLAHELRNHICNLRGIGDEENEEDEYERMYAAANHLRQSPIGLENGSSVHIPRGYELPIQQRGRNAYTDDNENAYDYII